MGPGNQKEKPRDRPVSAPSQAAIQGLLSADPQLKAHQSQPQSPGQAQKPQSGSNHVPIPAIKLVSDRTYSRSHSPCYRIDVDVEPDFQGGWRKEMRPALSHESLMVPSDWDVTPCDFIDPLSQSLPGNALHSALQRGRNTYSPVSNSCNLLKLPDNNQILCHVSDSGGRNERSRGRMQNAMRSSSSWCDISNSAPEKMLKQSLDASHLMSSRSSECLISKTPNSPLPWLGLSPYTSRQTSSNSLSTSPSSTSTLSPLFSPENVVFNTAHKSFPPLLQLPGQTPFPHLISPASTPHCSPYASPFGSQNQIYIRSVGAEC